MKSKKRGTVYAVQGALIAAIYAALTYAVAPLSFGAIQFRISEALTILPVFTPAAVPGLVVGCIISNIGSPYPLDIVFGTLATLLAALATRKARNICIKGIPLLSFLFPTVFNAVIVGAEITMFTSSEASVSAFLVSAASIFFGELVVCGTLGTLLYTGLKKTKIFDKK